MYFTLDDKYNHDYYKLFQCYKYSMFIVHVYIYIYIYLSIDIYYTYIYIYIYIYIVSEYIYISTLNVQILTGTTKLNELVYNA